jgi:hypothetical protein
LTFGNMGSETRVGVIQRLHLDDVKWAQMMKPVYRVLVLTVMATVLGASVAWSLLGNRDVSQLARPCRTGGQPVSADTGWKPVLLCDGWKSVLREPAVLASPETQACPWPAEDRLALVPLPETQGEPTLAPPEPPDGDLQRDVVVVRVEGKLRAPAEALSPVVPIPDPHNEPTLAPPEPLSGEATPRMIVVRVEAEQTAAADLPTGEGPRERPRAGGS